MNYTENYDGDSEWRSIFTSSVLGSVQAYSPFEENQITTYINLIDENSCMHTETVDDNLLNPKYRVELDEDMAVLLSKENQADPTNSTPTASSNLSYSWLTCDCVVHTSPEHLLAHVFDTESSHNTLKHFRRSGDDSDKFPRGIVRKINDHHHITHECRKLPFPLIPRDFFNRKMWKQLSADRYVLVELPLPEEDDSIPENFRTSTLGRVTRGLMTLVTFIERLDYEQSKATCFACVDLKGTLPAKVTTSFLVTLLDTVQDAADYFQRDKQIDSTYRRNFIDSMPSTVPLTTSEKGLIEELLPHTDISDIFDNNGSNTSTNNQQNLGEYTTNTNTTNTNTNNLLNNFQNNNINNKNNSNNSKIIATSAVSPPINEPSSRSKAPSTNKWTRIRESGARSNGLKKVNMFVCVFAIIDKFGIFALS